ncbi:hypothetical protein CA13_02980 [Planctomycetes bacterium CA13]|uniref:Secreted protein n=1 Tax=Novipirellula herctigrandis TaxID=2527986 RepID=A0A5C5YVW5_9BACT|nr:hypothetical protein CA13_02980 [Planctomycetes bacterium CA13]
MKKILLAVAVLAMTSFVGCEGPDSEIVVDKNEAAKYHIPADAMEQGMKDAAESAAKNAGKR